MSCARRSCWLLWRLCRLPSRAGPGARLAVETDQGVHSVRRRQRHRHYSPRGVRSARSGARSADRGREPRRRRRRARRRRGHARGSRRLHDPCGFLGAHRRAMDRAGPALRHGEGSFRRRFARQERECAGRQSVEGLEDGAGSRRGGESQSGLDQLRLGRRRHGDPCQRRTVSRQRGIRGDACSL